MPPKPKVYLLKVVSGPTNPFSPPERKRISMVLLTYNPTIYDPEECSNRLRRRRSAPLDTPTTTTTTATAMAMPTAPRSNTRHFLAGYSNYMHARTT